MYRLVVKNGDVVVVDDYVMTPVEDVYYCVMYYVNECDQYRDAWLIDELIKVANDQKSELSVSLTELMVWGEKR